MASEMVTRSDFISSIDGGIMASSSPITVSSSQPIESHTFETISNPSSAAEETIYIFENFQESTVTPIVTSSHETPGSMNKVLAISAPISESNMNILNEFQENQTSSGGEPFHIKVQSSIDVKTSKFPAEPESSQVVFKCENCDYSSFNKHYLKQHVDLVHKGGRPYKCPFCDYAGKRNHSLREHLVVHSNERPYECNHCNATFRKKGHLTNHVKLHASPKMIKCGLCPTETLLTDQATYLDHLQSVHKTNRLFACDVCEFVTDNEDKIRDHITQHSSETNIYQCGMCSFVTKDYPLIEAHLESHSSQFENQNIPPRASSPPKADVALQNIQTDRPLLFKCSECGFTASDTENMKEHMLHHIDNKTDNVSTKSKTSQSAAALQKPSYKCTDCSFVSNEATAFIHHMLIHKRNAKEQKEGFKTLYNIKPVSKENSCKTVNAPFYHDKTTGRFICTICGYGCEYQRTIKSHIWKHSGNKDVVYPMFQNGPLSVYEDNVTVAQSAPVSNIIPPNDKMIPVKKGAVDVNVPGPVLAPGTTICKIKISEDKMIAYMKEELKPSESDNENVLEDDYTESVPKTTTKPVENATKMSYKTKLSPPSKLVVQADSNPSKTAPVPITEKSTKAVVVEEVNAIPCNQEFTGMQSLHSSPKRPSSPLSFDTPQPKRMKSKTKVETTDAPSANLVKQSKIAVDTQEKSQAENTHENQMESSGAIITCLTEKKRPEIMDSVSKTQETGPRTRSKASSEKSKIDSSDKDILEMESSDTGDKSHGSNAPGGICSSLLAVIEQLRERSRTDIDAENYSKVGPKRSTAKRRSSRKDSSDDELPPEFVDSIEKISEEGEVRYRCKFCHYSNPKPLLIRIHMRLHKSKKPFECSLCDFVARSMEGLQIHMIQHCKVRTYQCKLCPSAFNYKSQLRAHMRAHTEKDTYICDFCDFVTANLTAYRQHTLVHIDTTSYACTKCHKKYSSKINLLRHVCAASQSDSLEEEQEISSDDETIAATKEMKCPHCSFTTIDVSEFTSHSTIHVDEDLVPVPLKCELCDFTAVSNRSLKSHMKRHINDQRYVQQPLEQYKCNLCGYVCHHLPSLKSHMWRHASDRNYSYEFTNDVINAAIDYDIKIDGRDINDPEILDRVLYSERKIVKGRLNNTEQPGGKMPVCWVTFRCCQCGFETINKPELNVHMRSHSDIIQQTLDISKTHRLSANEFETESQISTN